jgi:hypothetical protein
MESVLRNTKCTQEQMDVSTKQNRIAEIAKKYQDRALVSLHHHIDMEKD